MLNINRNVYYICVYKQYDANTIKKFGIGPVVNHVYMSLAIKMFFLANIAQHMNIIDENARRKVPLDDICYIFTCSDFSKINDMKSSV